MTDWKRTLSAWLDSSATDESCLFPATPHLEALLRTDWRRCRSVAEAKSDQAGQARNEEGIANAKEGCLRQTMAPKGSKSKKGLRTLTHHHGNLLIHFKVVLQNNTQYFHAGYSLHIGQRRRWGGFAAALRIDQELMGLGRI